MSEQNEIDPRYIQQHVSLLSPTGKRVGTVTIGGEPITISAGGKDWRFEWHSYCGPSVLGKNGDPLKNQLPDRHLFWVALAYWISQGQRIDESGRAIWSKP